MRGAAGVVVLWSTVAGGEPRAGHASDVVFAADAKMLVEVQSSRREQAVARLERFS